MTENDNSNICAIHNTDAGRMPIWGVTAWELPSLEEIGALAPCREECRPDLEPTIVMAALPLLREGPPYRRHSHRTYAPRATMAQRRGELAHERPRTEGGYRSRVRDRRRPHPRVGGALDAVLLVAGMILGADALIHIIMGAF